MRQRYCCIYVNNGLTSIVSNTDQYILAKDFDEFGKNLLEKFSKIE